jgi:hypothetical protein
VKKLQE